MTNRATAVLLCGAVYAHEGRDDFQQPSIVLTVEVPEGFPTQTVHLTADGLASLVLFAGSIGFPCKWEVPE